MVVPAVAQVARRISAWVSTALIMAQRKRRNWTFSLGVLRAPAGSVRRSSRGPVVVLARPVDAGVGFFVEKATRSFRKATFCMVSMTS
jgi:hypothetical protein